jgi:hypothetical protein
MQTRADRAAKLARTYLLELLSDESLDGDRLREAMRTLYKSGDFESGDFYVIGYLGHGAELRKRLIDAGLWVA